MVRNLRTHAPAKSNYIFLYKNTAWRWPHERSKYVTDCPSPVVKKYIDNQSGRRTIYWLILPILQCCKPSNIRCSHHCAQYVLKIKNCVQNINLRISLHHTENFTFWRGNGSSVYFNTFTAIVDLSRFNNSCLKLPASNLVDLTF